MEAEKGLDKPAPENGDRLVEGPDGIGLHPILDKETGLPTEHMQLYPMKGTDADDTIEVEDCCVSYWRWSEFLGDDGEPFEFEVNEAAAQIPSGGFADPGNGRQQKTSATREKNARQGGGTEPGQQCLPRSPPSAWASMS